MAENNKRVEVVELSSGSESDSSVEFLGRYDAKKRRIDLVVPDDVDSDSSSASTMSSASKSIVAHARSIRFIYSSDDEEYGKEDDELDAKEDDEEDGKEVANKNEKKDKSQEDEK